MLASKLFPFRRISGIPKLWSLWNQISSSFEKFQAEYLVVCLRSCISSRACDGHVGRSESSYESDRDSMDAENDVEVLEASVTVRNSLECIRDEQAFPRLIRGQAR